MASYWERRLQQNRQRSLQAQSDRYSAQVPSPVLEAQERRRGQVEAERVARAERERALARAAEARRDEEARRAQAEARAAQARREREEAARVEAARRAEAEARVNRSLVERRGLVGEDESRAALRRQFEAQTDLFAGSGTGRDERVEPRTPAEQQRSRDLAEFVLFGPERGSVAGGEAGRLERFVRDWGLSEQEFRLAGERAGEGRAGAAAGWAALGLAGAVPFFGDVAQGVGRAGRVASQAADVGRAIDFDKVVTQPTRLRGMAFSGDEGILDAPLGPVRNSDISENRTRLFHGTSSENVDSILSNGIRPSVQEGEAGFSVYGTTRLGSPGSTPQGPQASYGGAFEYAGRNSREFSVVEFVAQNEDVVPLGTSDAWRAVNTGDWLEDASPVPPSNIAAVHRFRWGDDGWELAETIKVNDSLGTILDDYKISQAADVGRVVGANIAQDIARETSELGGRLNPTTNSPQNMTAQANMREIIHRQGFDAPATRVSTPEFESAAASSRYPVVYRGVFGESADDAVGLGEDLLSGEFFVGTGRYGYGIYVTPNFGYAAHYAAGSNRASNRGAVSRFVVSDDARILEVPNTAGTSGLPESAFPEEIVRQKMADGFAGPMNEYLAALGYDGVAAVKPNGSVREMVLFNRSALVSDGVRATADEASGLIKSGRYDDAKDVIFGSANAARAGETAADVGRAAPRVEPRITLRTDQVERVQGMGNEHWFRVADPDNPRGKMTLPGTSGGGRIGGRPMSVDEVPDEIYHVTTNVSGVRSDGMINVSRGSNMGAGGTSGSGAVSLSATKETAERLASDLRAYAQLKNLRTQDEVIDFLLDISRQNGMTEEGLGQLREYLDRAVIAARGNQNFNPEIHAKSIYDAWQFARASRGGQPSSIILGNPFDDYWRTVQPEDIDIITVNKQQIPEGALINDYDVGRGALDEIQVYADIPLGQSAEAAANVARAGETAGDVGRASGVKAEVGALRPVGELPVVRNLDELDSSERLQMGPLQLRIDAKLAFRGSGVSDDVIERTANEVFEQSPRPIYDERGQNYLLAGEKNRMNRIEQIQEIGERLGIEANPTYAPVKNLDEAVQRFDELEPATNVFMKNFESILDSGGLSTPAERGASSASLGVWTPEGRLAAVERPRFGVEEGVSRMPVYGYLVGKRGTTPSAWEKRSVPSRTGAEITSSDAGMAYGEIQLRFSDDVRDSTSFSFGDSVRQPYGVGRPLSNVTPEDLELAGIRNAANSYYIETQMWESPKLEQIESITAPQRLQPRIQAMLDERGLDIPIYDDVDGTLVFPESLRSR